MNKDSFYGFIFGVVVGVVLAAILGDNDTAAVIAIVIGIGYFLYLIMTSPL